MSKGNLQSLYIVFTLIGSSYFIVVTTFSSSSYDVAFVTLLKRAHIVEKQVFSGLYM